MTATTILSLALPTPLRRHFDYLPPEGCDNQQWQPGQRLRVPFGRQQLVGLLIKIKRESEFPLSQLRPALALLDQEPLLPRDILELCQWAGRYYQCAPGEALSSALPGLLRQGQEAKLTTEKVWQLTSEGMGMGPDSLKRAPKQARLISLLLQHKQLSNSELRQHDINPPASKALNDKQLIEQVERQASATTHVDQPLLRQAAISLNPEQQRAFEQVELGHYRSYLLEGTTGSGKTEVYLQLVEQALKQNQQALILVPEIGLTPQTLTRFRQRFNTPIAALHSGLNDSERLQAWLQASLGQARIVIGTRSAIFTPLPQLGIIIIDEEHDGAFKQQDGFRYSARDLAVVRAQRQQIPLLLGTATPSLETLHNALNRRYRHLQLTQRAGGASAPPVQLLNICGQTLTEGFASEMLLAIQGELQQGNQVLIFLNRRGYAPTLMCHDCGWQAHCPHCDARLTLHQHPHHLHCHHCDHRRSVINHCPECRSRELQALGQGTERSEEALQALFPEHKILRIDRDSTRRKNAMQTLLDEIQQGEPCVLIGTQMLAKGHHFPDVTLVAIIDADSGLFSSDFRAPERMGQLLVQVAGRAGRADKAGRVMIQSHHCEHPLLQTLVQRGYHAYAQQLLHERQLGQLPPYRFMALIKAESQQLQDASNLLAAARQFVEQLQPSGPELQYLGPLSAPMERRSGRFRQQLHINASRRQQLQPLLCRLSQYLEQLPLARRVRWAIDVDPQDLS